ncbi:hypothetical protein BCR44DRAFT_1198774 [Catenaria anguillulae PL171]|uniref:Uncharacterized protein n=1 Tax=Catenaria anguillulae PL171 TaxID=765915 RepID=A0A1Y2HG61_9FUNG|nr:hypothetical protein BCR44DRAFT_1198774 [Catenaria anguillulae PL171]
MISQMLVCLFLIWVITEANRLSGGSRDYSYHHYHQGYAHWRDVLYQSLSVLPSCGGWQIRRKHDSLVNAFLRRLSDAGVYAPSVCDSVLDMVPDVIGPLRPGGEH